MKDTVTTISKIDTLFRILFTVLLFSLVYSQLLSPTSSNQLQVFFLDVEQGDATLIVTPSGHAGLVDVGSNNFVISAMSSLPARIKSIDFVILTHPDADHIEGYLELQKRFDIQNIFINKTFKENALIDQISESLSPNSNVFGLHEFNDFRIDDVYFDILWPEKDFLFGEIEDSNDLSISLLLTYGEFSLFLGGDLSKEYEDQIVIENNISDVDVLQVGHHGSNTSTSELFLEQIKPKVAVISAGKENRFGHPHKEVLDNLSVVNSKILRTDKSGTIFIKTDGAYMKINDKENLGV